MRIIFGMLRELGGADSFGYWGKAKGTGRGLSFEGDRLIHGDILMVECRRRHGHEGLSSWKPAASIKAPGNENEDECDEDAQKEKSVFGKGRKEIIRSFKLQLQTTTSTWHLMRVDFTNLKLQWKPD